MRILLVHNRYQQAGGEDSVFANEVALLRNGGHEVATLVADNDDIVGVGAKLAATAGVVWNPTGRRRIAAAIDEARPEIVHVHNFFPRFSPAIFWECAARGVASVLTLHNYRLACVNGLLFRDGHTCQQCLPGSPLPGIIHSCYRGSRLGSIAVAGMIVAHRSLGTWRRKVSRFVVPTEFGREIAIRAGVPADRISIKPNFVADPAPFNLDLNKPREGAVIVSRLSPEKGLDTALEAWRDLPSIALTIFGDGPERGRLEKSAPPWVSFAGFQSKAKILDAVASAAIFIAPSVCFETFGLAAAEAMAVATPVIAARIGGLASIITENETGLYFNPGDADDLRRVVNSAVSKPQQLRKWGSNARESWQDRFAPENNLIQIMAIYAEAISSTHQGHPVKSVLV